MRYSFIRHYRNLIGLLGIFSVALGCASTPKGHETFMAEGFRIDLPQPGSRVVVRGNHSEAVNQALGWLNDHQLLVVNRSVDKELIAPEIAFRDRTEQQAHVLAVAQKVGASLVVFAQVEETPLNQTVDPMSVGQQPMKIITVDILGIDAETGEGAFGARAWNSEPLVASQRVVQDLTTLALEKAWQEPEASLSRQQKMSPEIKTEQGEPLMTPVPLEPSGPSTIAQPLPGESTATSQEQVTIFSEPVHEEMPSAPVVTQPVTTETTGASEDPSLGLQIASGALSILYAPFKIVYAGLGGLFGCLAYAVTGGNEQVAQSVWDASLRGTYWLTPDNLQGNEPVRFKGEPAN